MSKVNAHGGCWAIRGYTGVLAGTYNRCETAEYEIDLETLIDDTTDSGSGGVAEGLPCIYKVNSLTMSVAEDDSSYPEVLGLTPMAVLDIYCRRGALNQWDLIEGAIFKTYRKVNDNNGKARRVSVALEYGRYTHNVSPPPGFGG